MKNKKYMYKLMDYTYITHYKNQITKLENANYELVKENNALRKILVKLYETQQPISTNDMSNILMPKMDIDTPPILNVRDIIYKNYGYFAETRPL